MYARRAILGLIKMESNWDIYAREMARKEKIFLSLPGWMVFITSTEFYQQRRRHKPDDIYKIKSTNTCTPRHMRLCKLDLYLDANIRLTRPG